MHKKIWKSFLVAVPILIALVLACPASAQFYKQVNLVSDISGMAAITDPLLVNPWGVSHGPMTPFWVSDQGKNMATLYAVDAHGVVSKVPLEIAIATSPSGQVFNGSPDFVVTLGGGSGPALFIFAGLNGGISGWNPGVPPPVPPAKVSTQATLAAGGTPPPVSYTGIALAKRGSDLFLYAANNAAGRIDVFDKNFAKAILPGSFTDPNLPAGNLPFNIVTIGDSLYLTYSGPTGIVNVFDTDGHFVSRFATGGTLVNPWGVALAPPDFGKFSNALLVGNFNFGDPTMGSGSISAFDLASPTHDFLGRLEDTDGHPISIDGLWSLTFGNNHNGGVSDVLYFSAGIQKQKHGLFASLSACHGPVISDVSTSPSKLWPPNHKMVPVTVNYAVADNCDPAPVCTLTVSSNEGGSSDWQVLDAHDVELRAERNGSGDGRIYTIGIDCTDKLPLSSTAKTEVTVAHDQGKHGH